MSGERRKRVPIEERREQILDAALDEFSHRGLHGGSTVAIAKAVDISHPNLFRIYSTKLELFMAVLERLFAKIERTMLIEGERDPANPLETMSDGWGELMSTRRVMFMLMQGYAASDTPEVRDLMHNWTRDVFERIAALPGVDVDTAHEFFADGMLYMAATAIDLPARAATDPWAARFLDSGS